MSPLRTKKKNVAYCLTSIAEQTYSHLEVILVDNNSSDKTREIALKFTDKIFNKGPERSAQRNHGMIKISHGKYVMFLDADMILAPKTVETCVSMIENGKWVALHIPEFVLGKKYFSRVRRFERSFYDGTVIDGARFFKKSVFEEVGGFDETMSGPEDWDIDKKIKNIGPIGLLPLINEYPKASSWKNTRLIIESGVDPNGKWNAVFHNEKEFKLFEYLSKKKYYSASIDRYTKKWGRNDPDIRKQMSIGYRFFGVFLERYKWKRFILNPYLVFGVYFLRFLVGLQFLKRNLS